MNIIQGDLLKSRDPVIAHQVNCIMTRMGKGLYEAICQKYPYGHIYETRREHRKKPGRAIHQDISEPGELIICRPHHDPNPSFFTVKHRPIIVGLCGQYAPGGSISHQDYMQNPRLSGDTDLQREEWFQMSLDNLHNFMITEGHTSVGIPYNIGCGIAGGDWENYYNMLLNLAKRSKGRYTINLYKIN